MKTTGLKRSADVFLAIIIIDYGAGMKVPQAVELAALKPGAPVLLSYVQVLIYLASIEQPSSSVPIHGGGQRRILWANLQSLFGLSLFPFTTA